MKLIGDFCHLLDYKNLNDSFTATIKLDRSHIVFKGHFPGHPVTPGVIQIQLVHELLEFHLKRSVNLLTIDECKFLHVLDPESTSQLNVNIELHKKNGQIKIKGDGRIDGHVFFKISSMYELS